MATAVRDDAVDHEPAAGFVGFAHALRAAGLPVGAYRTQAFLDASTRLGAGVRGHVYWAGRATLCASPDDIATFDKIFARWFSLESARQGTTPVVSRSVSQADLGRPRMAAARPPPPQGVSGAGNTNRGWGNTKPSEAPKKSSALFGAVIGGACVLALVGLGLVGFVAMRRASVPAATAAPPPAVSVVPTATTRERSPPARGAASLIA